MKKTRNTRPSIIGLDELLHGTPTIEQVAAFFRDGEFYEEHYLISAIKRYLLTDYQKGAMFAHDISIEDMLNGRTDPNMETLVNAIYDNWNTKLGFIHFRGL